MKDVKHLDSHFADFHFFIILWQEVTLTWYSCKVSIDLDSKANSVGIDDTQKTSLKLNT